MFRSDNPLHDAVDHGNYLQSLPEESEPVRTCDCCGEDITVGVRIEDEYFRKECYDKHMHVAFYLNLLEHEKISTKDKLNIIQSFKVIQIP